MSLSKLMDIKYSKGLYSVFEGSYKELIKDLTDKYIIIIDKSVNGLIKLHTNAKVIPIEANEKSKRIDNVTNVIEQVIELGFRKNDTLVAIGGGVIQDITGFIASVLYRGVKWYFVPTTLLSQCDSCIGSKTSINVGEYKNQIGTFYPPKRIVLDYSFLDTLPKEAILSGYGEIVKYHILDQCYDLVSDEIEDLIVYSLRVKQGFIEIDEYDEHLRKLLNYGHTFGHAIESATGNKIPHGLAVMIGLDITNYISKKLHNDTFYDSNTEVNVFIKETIPKIKNPKAICDYLKYDKKCNNGCIDFIIKDGMHLQTLNLSLITLCNLLEEYYND